MLLVVVEVVGWLLGWLGEAGMEGWRCEGGGSGGGGTDG